METGQIHGIVLQAVRANDNVCHDNTGQYDQNHGDFRGNQGEKDRWVNMVTKYYLTHPYQHHPYPHLGGQSSGN